MTKTQNALDRLEKVRLNPWREQAQSGNYAVPAKARLEKPPEEPKAA
jgi:hypothetical protein